MKLGGYKHARTAYGEVAIGFHNHELGGITQRRMGQRRNVVDNGNIRCCELKVRWRYVRWYGDERHGQVGECFTGALAGMPDGREWGPRRRQGDLSPVTDTAGSVTISI